MRFCELRKQSMGVKEDLILLCTHSLMSRCPSSERFSNSERTEKLEYRNNGGLRRKLATRRDRYRVWGRWGLFEILWTTSAKYGCQGMFRSLVYTQFSDALTQFIAVFGERAHREIVVQKQWRTAKKTRYATEPISSLRPMGVIWWARKWWEKISIGQKCLTGITFLQISTKPTRRVIESSHGSTSRHNINNLVRRETEVSSSTGITLEASAKLGENPTACDFFHPLLKFTGTWLCDFGSSQK